VSSLIADKKGEPQPAFSKRFGSGYVAAGAGALIEEFVAVSGARFLVAELRKKKTMRIAAATTIAPMAALAASDEAKPCPPVLTICLLTHTSK